MPLPDLTEVFAMQIAQAQKMGDAYEVRKINRAIEEVANNPTIRLVERRPALVTMRGSQYFYEFNSTSCNCPAGAFGNQCYHTRIAGAFDALDDICPTTEAMQAAQELIDAAFPPTPFKIDLRPPTQKRKRVRR